MKANHSRDRTRNRWTILIWVVVFALLLTACGGGTQPKTYTIGVVNLAPLLDDTVAGFKKGMTELGYIEGENITYIYEGPPDSIDKLHSVAQGLVGSDERIVVLSTGSGLKDVASAMKAVREPPVVVEPTLDAVKRALNT